MTRSWHFVLFRTLTSLIFLYAGAKHLLHADKITGRIQQCALYQWLPYNGLFSILVTASGVVMVVGAVLLLAGKYLQWTAAVLLFVLAGITFTIQLDNLSDLGPFFKNVAIAGSLLFIIQQKKYEHQKI